MDPRIDKAVANNYRRATDPKHGCHTCTEKQACPWLWCDRVGRQVATGMTCDKLKEGT